MGWYLNTNRDYSHSNMIPNVYISSIVCIFGILLKPWKKILTFFIAGWKLGNGLHNNFQPTILGIIAPLFYKYIMILCVVCFLYLNIKHQLKPIITQTLTNNIYSYLFLWKNIDLVNWYTNCFFNRTDSLVCNKF